MSYTYAPKPSQTRQRGRGTARAGTNSVNSTKHLSTKTQNGLPRNSNLSVTRPKAPQNTSSVRGRGRGRGRGRSVMDPSLDEDYSPSEGPAGGTQPPPQSTGQTDRMKRHDAFTMISPNEKKRQQIAAQAGRETENYERYKASQKVERVSYVGTAGGGNSGSVSEEVARKKLEREQQHAKFNRLQKSQHYKADQKRREDQEYQHKKDQARQKAQDNKMQDYNRQDRLTEEHRRTNEAFLARIERKQKKKKYKIPPATKPEDAKPQPSFHESSTIPPTEGAAAMYPPMSHTSSTLDELVHMYPGYDRQTLHDILTQCDGDIDAVSNLIG